MRGSPPELQSWAFQRLRSCVTHRNNNHLDMAQTEDQGRNGLSSLYIMNEDTLAMDSMDLYGDANPPLGLVNKTSTCVASPLVIEAKVQVQAYLSDSMNEDTLAIESMDLYPVMGSPQGKAVVDVREAERDEHGHLRTSSQIESEDVIVKKSMEACPDEQPAADLVDRNLTDEAGVTLGEEGRQQGGARRGEDSGPHNDDGAPAEVDGDTEPEQLELDRKDAELDETCTSGTHNRSLGRDSDDLGYGGPEGDLLQNTAMNHEDEPEQAGLNSTEAALEKYFAPMVDESGQRDSVENHKARKLPRIGKVKKISAYFTFANQNREAVKAEMVAAGKATIASEIAKILGERWRSLTATEKRLYTTGSDDLSKKPESTVSQKHMKGKDVVKEDPEYLDTLPDHVGDSNAPEFLAPFPISRVKRIIKLDKDIRLVANEGIVLITQATALFVEMLASASFSEMVQHKRKSVRSQDVLLAAKSKRQFRECLGNDLASLLNPSCDNNNTEENTLGEDDATEDRLVAKKPERQKSAKKLLQPSPSGSRSITSFFKA